MQGNVNYKRKSTGRTALIYAAAHGTKECVNLLIDSGAYVNVTDIEGNTALTAAIHNRHMDNFKTLLAAGAYVNHITGEEGITPLMVAAVIGHSDFVRVLLDAGANVNFSISIKNVPPGKLALLDQDRQKKIEGKTVLMMAILEGRRDTKNIVRLLLNAGADITARDKMGKTAFDYALQKGNAEIIQMLKETGSRTNQRKNTKMPISPM